MCKLEVCVGGGVSAGRDRESGGYRLVRARDTHNITTVFLYTYVGHDRLERRHLERRRLEHRRLPHAADQLPPTPRARLCLESTSAASSAAASCAAASSAAALCTAAIARVGENQS